ncbi:MAG: MFS transporter [Acidobacteriota bacterium]
MKPRPKQQPEGIPGALDERGFYYGWVVLAAGTIGIIMSVPGQTMGVSVYTNHLLASLPIDRVMLSFAYLLGTLGSAFLLPLVGRLLDRLGARVLGTAASVCLALALLFLAASPSLLHFLVRHTPFPAPWIAFVLAFVGFLGIRHFGQGQLTVIGRTMIGRWFERRRGLVFGISGFFVAFGFGVAPMVLNHLITDFGWQRSLALIAGVLLVLAVFSWATFRNSPEECGLVLDGRQARAAKARRHPAGPPQPFTAREAGRTLTFWIFNLGLMGQAMVVSAVTFHMGRIAQLDRMTAARAFSVFLPIAVLSTTSELSCGILSDRVPLKYLLAFMQFGLCLGILGMRQFDSERGYAMAALGLGISNGLYSLLTGAAWPRLFGRRHLGAIAGLSMGGIVAASSLGPFLFSLGQAESGSFAGVMLLVMLLPATVFAASFFADPPAHPAPGFDEPDPSDDRLVPES